MEYDELDALNAVVAHGLLNSMALVTGSLGLLSQAWTQLSDEQRLELVNRADSHAQFIAGVLGDLVRGLPVDVIRALGPFDGGPQVS